MAMNNASRTRQASAIYPSDILHISAASDGFAPFNLTVKGANDLTDILKCVRSNVESDVRKVVRIQLRNSTQGWTTRHTIVLGKQ